jgi:GntR family transcriptional regulator
MAIRVRPDSPVPIYEQIVSQMVFAIAGGDWVAGDLLPSVRDLATELVINPNTVVRAYQELERMGAIESRRGLGMAVTPDGAKVCREKKKDLVRDKARDVVREAVAAGLSLSDVQKLIEQEWPSLKAAR